MNKTTLQRRAVRTIALAVMVALAGCQTTGPLAGMGGSAQTQPQTAAEKQMQQDQERVNNTVFSAVLTGAVGGAAVGALTALLTGNTKKKDVAKGAAIGAVAGGVLVGVDGYITAKKEQAGRQGIRVTQAAANDLQLENAHLQSYLDSSGRVLAEGRTRLTNLKQEVASKKVSADEARRVREREERNIGSMTETLKQARETRKQYSDTAAKLKQSNENTGNLDTEIRKMDTQIGQLQNTVDAYRQALEVSRA
ncbi:MAG: hypothetical protein WA159_15005 [Variovorax sp.]